MLELLGLFGCLLLAVAIVAGIVSWASRESPAKKLVANSASKPAPSLVEIKGAWLSMQVFASNHGITDWNRDSIKTLIADLEMPTGETPNPPATTRPPKQ